MKYETKDSGARASFSNGGVRDTQEGKPRFDLIFPKNVPYSEQLITRVAELMGRGAEKYDDRNWEQFSDEDALDRAKASAARHLIQWLSGEEDEDHGAAVVFNIMAADYVRGVLAGEWKPLDPKSEPVVLTANDLRPASLWTGWSSGPPPPDYVQECELVSPRNEKNAKYRLIRAKNGKFYWTGEPFDSHEVRELGDFTWFFSKMEYDNNRYGYHLVEVRR